MDPEPVFLTTAEAAKLLRKSPSYLEKLRFYRQPGPPLTRIGRSVLYDRQGLIDWAKSRQEAP